MKQEKKSGLLTENNINNKLKTRLRRSINIFIYSILYTTGIYNIQVYTVYIYCIYNILYKNN